MALKTLVVAVAATGLAAWYSSNRQRRLQLVGSHTREGVDASNAARFDTAGSELTGDEGVRSLYRGNASDNLGEVRGRSSAGRTDDLLSPGTSGSSNAAFTPGSGV